MLPRAPRRGGGRSWLVVLLVSLTTLVVAACGLGGGVWMPTVAAYPDSATAEGAVGTTPLALPSPVLPGEPPGSAPPPSGSRPAPLWSGDAAGVARSSGSAPVPRRLSIPRLGVEMPIDRTGVTGDGQMALPERPDRIGWYRYGPRPGDRAGSAVLAGHVDSREFGIGPLAQLRHLKRGDRITVGHADGAQAYVVKQIQLVSKRTVPLDEVFDRTGPAKLRIVTCGGPYVPSRGGYLDNLVISADPQ